jgi:SOS-response transcriptional repressor LexA
MVGIFAIIASIGQAIFAIVAIDLFANIANTNVMSDLNRENKLWLANKLKGLPRGAKRDVAKALGKGADVVTRMANVSDVGESRDIHLPELHILAQVFNDTPPGLVAPREIAAPPDRSRQVVHVPLLGKIQAGKLRNSLSQVLKEEWPTLSFSGLGRGEFFALRVEGDSMDRISPEGSIIVVNGLEKNLMSGRCYIFEHRGEMTFKMWQGDAPAHLAPYSTNPANKPIFPKKKSDFEVIGRVKRTVLDL